MADIRPSHTVYVKNLNEKTAKPELKRLLYYLFSQHGTILDVVALKTPKMRGQAHIVFAEIPDATKALRSLQGFPFLDKPMRLQYAKTDSEVIARIKGSAQVKKSDKKTKTAVKKKTGTVVSGSSVISSNEGETPDKVLFVTNLPDEANEMMITMLFQQFTGFVSTRIIPGKRGMAFVDFDNERNASLAKDSLQAFKISPTNAMKITYASK